MANARMLLSLHGEVFVVESDQRLQFAIEVCDKRVYVAGGLYGTVAAAKVLDASVHYPHPDESLVIAGRRMMAYRRFDTAAKALAFALERRMRFSRAGDRVDLFEHYRPTRGRVVKSIFVEVNGHVANFFVPGGPPLSQMFALAAGVLAGDPEGPLLDWLEENGHLDTQP